MYIPLKMVLYSRYNFFYEDRQNNITTDNISFHSPIKILYLNSIYPETPGDETNPPPSPPVTIFSH